MFSMSAISRSERSCARRHLADDDWHAEQAGLPGRAPAALAGDDLKSIADLADDDRLDDAVRLDRPREIRQALIVHQAARLKRVGRQPIDVDLERSECAVPARRE